MSCVFVLLCKQQTNKQKTRCCVLDVIHKFVRDLYSKRFPELESLVHTAIEYVRTVQVRVWCVCVCDTSESSPVSVCVVVLFL